MAASLDSMWEGVDAVPPVQRDVLSKTRLTDWDLMRGLGEGEFAKVQACRRRGETIVRACKHISKARLICQSNVKRTLRRVRRVGTEIEAMRKLRHKSICQIFDVVHTPDYVHIVMENGGRDLYEIIGERRDDQVSLTFASEIGHALASGLGHCQEHGVVHRDVKPENVLVRFDPHNPDCVQEVKLCDFGLCAIAGVKLSPAEYLAATLADAGCEAAAAAAKPPPGEVRRDWTLTDFSGSPGFVAPEMVTDESYDGRFVDAWSLGCLVLELVVGHGTFDHVWMSAYSHDTMADRDAFARALANALRLLRALPQFRAPAAALADPTAEAPLQLNALGGFLFALLEVPPTKRADIRRVHTHPWLATVEARESALARAEAVACGDAAHLDASGCVLTSAIEISA